MTERIRVEIVNDEQLQQLFARLIGAGSNLRPLMQRIEGHLLDEVEEAFEQETAPGGAPWPDLADSTKRVRAATGHWPGKMLQVSGRLAASYTGEHGDDYALVGSNAVQAAIQQLGGQAGRDHAAEIPARSVLGLTPDTVQLILLDARQLLDDAVSGR